MTKEDLKKANAISERLKSLDHIENIRKNTPNNYFTYSGYYDDKGIALDENISLFLMPVFESFLHKYRADLEKELQLL